MILPLFIGHLSERNEVLMKIGKNSYLPNFQTFQLLCRPKPTLRVKLIVGLSSRDRMHQALSLGAFGHVLLLSLKKFRSTGIGGAPFVKGVGL